MSVILARSLNFACGDNLLLMFAVAISFRWTAYVFPSVRECVIAFYLYIHMDVSMHACVCNINISLICPQCKDKRSVIFFKSPGIMLLVHHVFLLCISGSRTLHQCLYICHVTELYSEMSGKILDSFATIITVTALALLVSP